MSRTEAERTFWRKNRRWPDESEAAVLGFVRCSGCKRFLVDPDRTTTRCPSCSRAESRARRIAAIQTGKCIHCHDNRVPGRPICADGFCYACFRERHWKAQNIEIAWERYVAMLKEGCALRTLSPCGKGALAVDHDHTTGRVRGLLCDHHNRLLGLFEGITDLSAIRRYLTQ